MSAYAELAVATNFSFLRGASHAEELVMQAKALGLAGLGIADRNSVAGVVRAHEAAKEAGVRLAVGARLVFADGTPDILAYPQDRPAWGRLTRLLTLGKRRAQKGDCVLALDDLLAHIEGLNLIVVPGPRPTSTSPRVRGEVDTPSAATACRVRGRCETPEPIETGGGGGGGGAPPPVAKRLSLSKRPLTRLAASLRATLSPQAGRGI